MPPQPCAPGYLLRRSYCSRVTCLAHCKTGISFRNCPSNSVFSTWLQTPSEQLCGEQITTPWCYQTTYRKWQLHLLRLRSHRHLLHFWHDHYKTSFISSNINLQTLTGGNNLIFNGMAETMLEAGGQTFAQTCCIKHKTTCGQMRKREMAAHIQTHESMETFTNFI